ncbi:S-adenosyl-L-methionine-dependent methyltransferase [Rickenella mellea]|uniref:S-adenosyl-L-methionine-dependent methyltransferase n=1 Tax=Rickenella mellea TaxID=50990 RepID=A0A4Y7PK09_9AGAM|nr:S-adenosyl-L-methionine-dependent methyltransferase [Rickenella mellea]
MSTFSKATFNAAKYAAGRPTYPRQLFDFVLKYHETSGSGKHRWDTAVDLGCGTGQATVELNAFKRVIGVDPSTKMIDGAKQYVELLGPVTNQFEFVTSPAENLSFLEDGSVDLVVSAQSAHWLDWHKLWPELARILRKDGSVAIWGYSQMRLTQYPSITPFIHEFFQGKDPKTSLGPYWEQPGRSILDNHFLDLPKATDVVPDAFQDAEFIYYTGDHYPKLPSPRPVILRKTMTWEGFETYIRSASSLHNYQERFPDDLNRADGDIATRFIRQLKEQMDVEDAGISKTKDETKPSHQDGAEDSGEGDVTVEWPLALLLVKRA